MSARTTIHDVAKQAGVSVTTVSHALSGRRPVGTEVKKRVLAAVNQLNYRSTHRLVPAELPGGEPERHNQVCILIDQCRNPATAIYLDAMESALRENGYDVILGIAGLDVDAGRALIAKYACGPVVGIINMLPQIDPDDAAVLAGSTRIVTHIRQADAPVYIDYEGGARQAFEYLRGQGHRRIGYIQARRRRLNAPDPLLAGCESLLAACGETFPPELVVKGDDTPESARAASRALFERGVTAIFAGNDQMALGVYQAAQATGRRLPDDLSVVGFDDTPLAISVHPLLTTVQVPFTVIAAHTVATLVDRIEGRERQAQPVVIRPQLIVRDSVARVPVVAAGDALNG